MAYSDVQFCLLVERGPLEAQATLLCESIRAFGGRYKDAPITAISPRADCRPAQAVQKRLAQLGVDYRALDLSSSVPEYGTSFRVHGLAAIAREAGPPLLVQLDTDTVFVGEPDFEIGEDLLLARPVDEVGMCSTGPADPRDALWEQMCRVNGVALEELGWVDTAIGGVPVRSSFNGGLIAARRQLFVETEDVFDRIVAAGLRSWPDRKQGERIGAGNVGARGFGWWGTSQAAIAIAAARLRGRHRLLDARHNLPLHRADRLRDIPAAPVHIHYHWLFEKRVEAQAALATILPLHSSVGAWLAERLPLRLVALEGTGVFHPRALPLAPGENPTQPAPACSVVMTCYRDARYLGTAVSSVLAQEFSDFELIIVDDGSPDPEPVAALASLDPRIRILRLDANVGTAEAANRGIKLARADIIARIDSDDVAEPTWLGGVVGKLAEDPELGLVGSAVTLIDEKDRVLRVQRMPESDFAIRFTLLFQNPFYHSTVAYRRALFEAAGGYRADQPVSQDHHLWYAMLPLTRARNLAEPLVRYRINPAGLTQSNSGADPRARTRPIRSALWREVGIPFPLDRSNVAGEADRLLRHLPELDGEAANEAREIVAIALQRVLGLRGDFQRVDEQTEAERFASELRARIAVRQPRGKGILRRRLRQAAARGLALVRRGKSLRSLARPRPKAPDTIDADPVFSALHDVSPYRGFDPRPFPADLQGWGSQDPAFRSLIAELRPTLIAEIGSWKGASAIHMASLCREFGLDSRIVCIDTWLGSSEHVLGQRAQWRQSLQPRHGYPQLYYTFLANVVRSGYAPMIVPLPNTSDAAAIVLRAHALQPDLVYIDGSHEEDAVYRDLSNYWPLLKPGGAILGDDFTKFPGVRRATQRWASELKLHIEDHGEKFVVRKPASAQGPNRTGVEQPEQGEFR